MAGNSKRAILAALFANAGIAISKFIGFFVTRSPSMLAEAIHSVADTSNQALLLLGSSRAQRPATPTHPFGFGRERYFWSFVVAVVLFSIGGLFALYEGIEKLRHPHELASPQWAIGILIVAIGLETWSFRTAIVESNHVRGNNTWWQFIRRSRTPELPVVLLEDLGALVGLIFALGGVSLAVVTGDPRFDAAGSVAIGVLLIIIAIILVIEMKSLLIGESATDEHVNQIRVALTETPGVVRVIHMRTQHLGPEELLVAAKLEFEDGLTFSQVVERINACETAVRAKVPSALVMYLEPDRHDPARRD